MKENEAIAIFFQIAEGVEYLYDNEIIHGDIKSCNILISKDGINLMNIDIVKICDIGLMRLIVE